MTEIYEEITDIDEWAETALLNGVAGEEDPDIRLSFAQSLGELSLKRQGIDISLEE